MLMISTLAARFGLRPAVVDTATGTMLTYASLAARVEDLSRQLGESRRLVLVEARNDLPTLVAYLAALQGRHPVLLAPGAVPASLDALRRAIDPDVVLRSDAGRSGIEVVRPGSRHSLHPDLAMLASTSGSTGSAKLVRLSLANLAANAESIATYLDLAPDDRAMTSLPMHYCYGLSVINSHLVRGASISLTERSVIDPRFFESFRETGSTSFAGVPHTFDLLDRVGDEWMDLPGLRHVTQAGGRLAPEHVRRLARAGEDRGWRFFVMYGQTEATARMAYLPPEIAATHPGAIGRAVPGGALDLLPVAGRQPDGPDTEGRAAEGPDIGELVYRGPNVMLGYAESPADLALGRTVDELRTGDLARRNEAGLFEIIGRCSRFVKIFGLRLDLDRIEQALAEEGLVAACTGDDHRLVIACTAGNDGDRIVELIARRFHLPAGRVVVRAMEKLPRCPSGKIDYVAINASTDDAPDVAPAAADDSHQIRRVFAAVFPGRALDDDSTFIGLGGDSLTYVELSVRLEEAIGHLPDEWPTMPLHRLAPRPEGRPRSSSSTRWAQVETNIVVRAAAIVAVVASHAGLLRLKGGGHVLLAIAGYNFARFQLRAAHADGSAPRLARTMARVAFPAVAWMAVLLATTDDYGVANLLLVNNQVGPSFWDQRWRYWYVEALVQILALAAAAFAIPLVRRAEQRDPFRVALVAFGLAVALRFALHDVGGVGRSMHRPQTVVWLFALGWLAHTAGSDRRRQVLVGALTLAAVPGFFVNDQRTVLVIAAVLVVLAMPRVLFPAAVVRLASSLASASLYIYLTHWQVYPAMLTTFPPIVAVTASLFVGVTLSVVARRGRSRWASWAAAGATARVPVGSGLRVRSPRAA